MNDGTVITLKNDFYRIEIKANVLANALSSIITLT